jgi:hypothetical protein
MWKIKEDKLVVNFKPLYTDEVTFELERPHPEAQPVEFKTATTGMKVVRAGDKLYLEKLCVDGRMRHMEYQGAHLGDLNFHNFGWDGPTGRKYLRIDVYTGECSVITE